MNTESIKLRLLGAIAALGLALAVVPMTGCDNDGPAEEAGEAIDDAVDDTGDALDDAADDVDDAIDDIDD